MRTKDVPLIRRIEKKVDEDGSREGYLGGRMGGREKGIYRKYLFLREVSRVEVGRGKGEDKEHIGGNREKCPGETRRSFSGVSGKDRGVSA